MIFFYSKKNAPISPSSFDADLSQKLGNPKFASAYIMSAIVDNDLNFLPIALGDVAKAHGVSKFAEQTGINRRTLYKVFDKKVHPSFDLVARIMESLGMEIQIRPKKAKRKKAT
ncbi:MAG: addiction module antidote protein [Pseudobdellovibrionaceae bacterium]